MKKVYSFFSTEVKNAENYRRKHLEVLGQVLEETRGGREQAIEQKRKRKQAVETRLEAIRKKQQKFKQQKEHEHRQQQYAEKRQQPGIQEDTAKRDS